jgi:hypothetical protein
VVQELQPKACEEKAFIGHIEVKQGKHLLDYRWDGQLVYPVGKSILCNFKFVSRFWLSSSLVFFATDIYKK